MGGPLAWSPVGTRVGGATGSAGKGIDARDLLGIQWPQSEAEGFPL